MKYIRLAVLLFLGLCMQVPPVWGCRYNVRETGFADLGTGSYRFYGYVNETIPAEIVSAFSEISHAAFRDSNIEFEIINMDRQKDHPALKYVDLWRIRSFPAAVLVSPDGQSLAVSLDDNSSSFRQKFSSAVSDIVSSPTRDKILRQVIESYGVVLLVEGPDAEENRSAREIAERAIENTKRQMRFMPKTILQPPSLMVLEREVFSRDEILAWSLGLDAEKVHACRVAVLYGRARWIGPLFGGRELSERALTQVLSIIGEDCECGLDWKVLQGTMLPTRWDEKIQSLAAAVLGFNPENPMIKLEMSQILRKGTSLYPGVPVGSRRTRDRSRIDYDLFVEGESPLKKQLYLMAALAALIIFGGLLIAMRAAKRNP
jgi:hypothetical protein